MLTILSVSAVPKSITLEKQRRRKIPFVIFRCLSFLFISAVLFGVLLKFLILHLQIPASPLKLFHSVSARFVLLILLSVVFWSFCTLRFQILIVASGHSAFFTLRATLWRTEPSLRKMEILYPFFTSWIWKQSVEFWCKRSFLTAKFYRNVILAKSLN